MASTSSTTSTSAPRPAAGRSAPAGRARPTGRRITVEDVSFRYPGQDRPAVHGVSLEIRRGQIVALVGENGSGKTTLARLIAGLYQPDAGRTWDRVPLSVADAERVWAQVALVPQDYARWPFTAGQNIGIGPRRARLRQDRGDLPLRDAAWVDGRRPGRQVRSGK